MITAWSGCRRRTRLSIGAVRVYRRDGTFVIEQRSAHTIRLGDVDVSRVVEWEGPIAPPTAILPDAPHEVWERNQALLAPHFWDPETDMYRAAMNTWVLRSAGRTILVDTGIGNDKYRPYFPVLSYLKTDFLGHLAALGVAVEDVDLVINTHVHADHVGWNTTLVDGAWVPTFPNARYLINAADVEYWNPLNGHPKSAVVGGLTAEFGNQNMYEDSVAPVIQAGQATLWENEYVIDENLRLRVEPGHTPGSSVLTLTSGSDRAVFVGDMLHTPTQIIEPQQHSCFDEDRSEASATRRRVLSWAADNAALVLPAHFPGAGAAEIVREGERFAVKNWAPFTPASAR
ncbi:MBL fold metallo-hydrolase [Dactylosporangium sp. CA-092794]|uniref:MBL fold metallo-hydrolase n=1 Tax=Dactylosporangium sp. CA-092794 TaxID=3239929 RepID=UPI003D8F156F